MVADSMPMVTSFADLSLQVCVPADWTDAQILAFAKEKQPDAEWAIRREGDVLLRGDPERAECEVREGFVHVMLDC